MPVQDTLLKATGDRGSDCLTLSNQWATVTITRHWDDQEFHKFHVSGDVRGDNTRVVEGFYNALELAAASLADYAAGRAD